MTSRPRIRHLGVEIGDLPPGEHNAITDVPGVWVGHDHPDRATSHRWPAPE